MYRGSVPALSAVAVVAMLAPAEAQRRVPQEAPPPGRLSGTVEEPTKLATKLPSLDDETWHVLALQVALDRAGFSPGEIDGTPGINTDRAMAAFMAARGAIDLGAAYSDAVALYTITAADVAGPFAEQIPEDMVEKAQLPALGYTSVQELVAERFHASPRLLTRLNPGAAFREGETIVVPNVEPFYLPVPQATIPADASAAGASRADGTPSLTPSPQQSQSGSLARGPQPPAGATVIVTDSAKSLQVIDAAGQVLLHAPVTTGSGNDPLPIGEWAVAGVSRNPVFNYNPSLFWDADPSHAKAKIAAGPNNPVGVVWIDLDKEHYGIHGTPEPGRVGYAASHGCIRLTNWDATRLAALVRPGTRVILR